LFCSAPAFCSATWHLECTVLRWVPFCTCLEYRCVPFCSFYRCSACRFIFMESGVHSLHFPAFPVLRFVLRSAVSGYLHLFIFCCVLHAFVLCCLSGLGADAFYRFLPAPCILFHSDTCLPPGISTVSPLLFSTWATGSYLRFLQPAISTSCLPATCRFCSPGISPTCSASCFYLFSRCWRCHSGICFVSVFYLHIS